MIQPVNFLKTFMYANFPRMAKAKKSLVDLPSTLTMYNKIVPQYQRMEYVANTLNIPFRFVQKGDSVLANFGAKTAIIKSDASQKEIFTTVNDLICSASSMYKVK